MSFYKILLTLAVPLTLLAGCQSQPKAPPSTEQLTSYAEAIRSGQIADLTQFRECYALGGETSQLVADSREAWQFRHGELFAAADSHLLRARSDWITIEQKSFSLRDLQTLKAISEATRRQLNLAQRGASGQKNTCQRAMASIGSRDYKGLATENRVVDALLAQTRTRSPQQPDTEIQFDHFAAAVEPGRSYYTISDALQSACDGQLVVETLVNDWPREDYGAFCQGESLYHIHCEWGECQRRRPGTTPQ